MRADQAESEARELRRLYRYLPVDVYTTCYRPDDYNVEIECRGMFRIKLESTAAVCKFVELFSPRTSG